MTELTAGLLLGVAAGAHCVVMCGPLVAALHRPLTGTGSGALTVTAVYHAARISAYATLGLVAGLAGHAVALGGLGRALSVAAGLGLLGLAAHGWGLRVGSRLGSGPRVGVWIGRALSTMARRGQTHPLAMAAAGGAVNAVLPCGVLYGALAASAALGDAARAAGFMTLYGAGTLPLLAAVTLWPARTASVSRRDIAWVRAAALIVVGLLLVGRGLMPLVDHAVRAAHGH